MSESRKLKIRPYARLLTMLGEQLIKNERIALMELVKNSYDADADWVKISFQNFGDGFTVLDNSKIIIEDNGCGMNEDVIINHWLNPATPEKRNRKNAHEVTKKGRIMQGEKGIGRFAMLKLGKKVVVTSRGSEGKECKITYDFSMYNDDFRTKEKDLYLSDLNVHFESYEESKVAEKTVSLGSRKAKRGRTGTIIEISDLQGAWNSQKVKDISQDIFKLKSIFPDIDQASGKNRLKKLDFEVYLDEDGENFTYAEETVERMRLLLQDRSVIRIIDGCFKQDEGQFIFNIDGFRKQSIKLSLGDQNIRSLKVFRDYFKEDRFINNKLLVKCGDFKFSFYIFDLSAKAPLKYKLDKVDKDIIRPHRIYLYRDGIRVYPYGDQEDDWLHIDQLRGTVAAGDFLSNDQVVGVVEITQSKNPMLKDKTNREGLIDNGYATGDFIALLQSLLVYLRAVPYRKYQLSLEDKKAHDVFRGDIVQKELDTLKGIVKDDKKATNQLKRVDKAYLTERAYLVSRAEKTEDLAAVGNSVEVASHDIAAVLMRALETTDSLIKDINHKDVNPTALNKDLIILRGSLSFVQDQLLGMQSLFVSSKQRRKNIRVAEIVDKVAKMYQRLLNKHSIEVNVEKKGSPLIAKATDAVLMQLLLNLFDNSAFWLGQVDIKKKRIQINLDGDNATMIFSDNGPGIPKDDIPYIFEPFFSAKGEEGRGLGLYIARQLLERSDYSINLAELKSERLLKGANFLVSFISEKEK